MADSERDEGACAGCRRRGGIRWKIDEILEQIARDQPGVRQVPHGEYERRLACCRDCASLQFGSTCRHCGCLVHVRARIEGKHCPRPGNPVW